MDPGRPILVSGSLEGAGHKLPWRKQKPAVAADTIGSGRAEAEVGAGCCLQSLFVIHRGKQNFAEIR